MNIFKKQSILINCTILFLLSCNNNLCGNSNVQVLSSPKKTVKLVKYERDCGATTSTALTLALLKYSEVLSDNTQSFFVAGNGNLTSINCKWINDSVLFVSYSKELKIFKSDSLVRGIKVLYRLQYKDSSSKSIDTTLNHL